MNIIEKLKWRYATKKFDETAILDESKINILKEAFNLTATSYGLQPIKLIFLQDKALQKELVVHSMDQEQVAQASHILVFCIETIIDKAYVETYFKRIKTIRNTPDDILEPFKDFLIDDFEERTKAHIEDWATKQAYLAMGNLLTVCAVEGIDSCPMEGFSPEDYDRILDLKSEGLSSVLVMPIGIRADDDMFADFKKVRKKVNESTADYQ
ncbi:MAG: nitroreductase family protein [Bacteroidia bacterium]|nr:nitroreductase family protein [Bacteroidia bacterium]RZW54893.1 MAG: NAD(P)H-dependent oxidoreductase [Flavobacteriaceae bacterium]